MDKKTPYSVDSALDGYILSATKTVDKSSAAQQGFLRFKIQVCGEEVKSGICFNINLLPELKKAESDAIGRTFTGLKKPKSQTTVVLGQSATIEEKNLAFCRLTSFNSSSEELNKQFLVGILSITAPINTANDKSFFRFLASSADEISQFIVFDVAYYNKVVQMYIDGSQIEFFARTTVQKFGPYSQYAINQTASIVVKGSYMFRSDEAEIFLYARRLFGKSLSSSCLFKETVSCIALAIEKAPLVLSDGEHGVLRYRFYEPFDNEDFVVKIQSTSGITIELGQTYLLFGYKKKYPDDSLFLVISKCFL